MATSTPSVQMITSEEQLLQLIAANSNNNNSGNPNNLLLLNFAAAWCEPCTHMNQVFASLASKYANKACFLQIDADEVDVGDRFGVTAVPSFLFMKDGKVLELLVGANPAELAKKTDKFVAESEKSNETKANKSTMSKESLDARLKQLTNYAPVMVFVKGTPDAPRCGFSKKILALLKDKRVTFSSFDILSDNDVRQGLKTYSNWPTYPQLYVDGKLIGGLDIVKEMDEEGELLPLINEALAKQKSNDGDESMNEKLKELTNLANVVLFMKGTPDAPQCGFSSKAVGILNDNGITFSSFNILSNERVRQALKKYSNWPTYPQLYVSGKLIGGLDILKELAEDGELLDMIPPSEIAQ